MAVAMLRGQVPMTPFSAEVTSSYIWVGGREGIERKGRGGRRKGVEGVN